MGVLFLFYFFFDSFFILVYFCVSVNVVAKYWFFRVQGMGCGFYCTGGAGMRGVEVGRSHNSVGRRCNNCGAASFLICYD